jgi:hypothetical protein
MEENGISSDDRLFAALAYFFSPLVPVIILFAPDKKERRSSASDGNCLHRGDRWDNWLREHFLASDVVLGL